MSIHDRIDELINEIDRQRRLLEAESELSMPEHYKSFTLVFDGDIRNFPNPFTTDSPWGKPRASCVWDALERGQS